MLPMSPTLIVVMVSVVSAYTQTHQVIHIKYVYMVYINYSSIKLLKDSYYSEFIEDCQHNTVYHPFFDSKLRKCHLCTPLPILIQAGSNVMMATLSFPVLFCLCLFLHCHFLVYFLSEKTTLIHGYA